MAGFTESLVTAEAGYGHVYGPGRDLYLYAGGERAGGFHPHRHMGYDEFTSGEIPDDYLARTKDNLNYRASFNWNHNSFGMVGFIQKEWLSLDNYSILDDGTPSPEIYYQTLAVRPSLTFSLTSSEELSVNLPMAFFDNGYIYDRIKQGSTRTVDHGDSDMRIETNWVVRSLRWEGHQLAAGFRASRDEHSYNSYYFRSDPPDDPFGEDVDWREYSLFAEDIIDITPSWTVTAGIRFNAIRYQLNGDQDFLADVVDDSQRWFPRIATAIRIGDDTTVKLSYQEGYHYPSATALYASQLKPEYSEAYEVNLLHALPGLGLNFTVNGFFNVYKNAVYAYGKDDFGSLGGEIMVDWRGPDSIRAMVSYSYSRPCDISDGESGVNTANDDITEWLSYPAHSVKALISRRWLRDTLMTSLALEYGSGVGADDSIWYESRSLFNNDRFSISFKTSYSISEHLNLNLVVNNMVDNNIPVATGQYFESWEGNLGATETRYYLGLTWQ